MEPEVRSKSQTSNQSRASKSINPKSKITFQNTAEENDVLEESDNDYTDAEDNNREDEEEPTHIINPSRSSHQASFNNDSLSKSATIQKSSKSNSKLTNMETINSKPTYMASMDSSLIVRSFKTRHDNSFYPISANGFNKFESMLFDLIGLPNSNAFKPMECFRGSQEEQIDGKRTETDLHNVESIESFSNVFISNMNILSNMLEVNVHNEYQQKYDDTTRENIPHDVAGVGIKKLPTKSGPKALKETEEPFTNKFLKTNLVNPRASVLTVIHHTSSSRPRKALRILLSKKSSISMDSILNEICNLFRLEYAHIRRLYSLSGMPIGDLATLINQELVFIVIGNEKLHSKDLELDQAEKNQFFTCEFMKNVYSIRFCKIERSIKNGKSLRMTEQAHVDMEKIIENSQTQVEGKYIPVELLNNYDIGEVVGEGHYAVVHKCRDINTELVFALKIVDLKKNISKENNMIKNELEILRRVKHPNIVKLIEEYKTKDHVYLIMEFLKAGDLLDDLTARKKYTEKEAALMLHNLTSAVAYLHAHELVHRDIKLENILIQKSVDGSRTLKLADFGLAIRLERDQKLNQKCGSPVYVAPEILLGKSYGYEVDIWSLGVIMYILLGGYAPFQGETDEKTFELIKNSDLVFPDMYWEGISEDAKDLIRLMLNRNQIERISAEDVLKHKWVVRNLAEQQS